MTHIATYYQENFFYGISSHIFAEHFKCRNIYPDYAGSIIIKPSISVEFNIQYWINGEKNIKKIQLHGSIHNLYKMFNSMIGNVDDSHYQLIHLTYLA